LQIFIPDNEKTAPGGGEKGAAMILRLRCLVHAINLVLKIPATGSRNIVAIYRFYRTPKNYKELLSAHGKHMSSTEFFIRRHALTNIIFFIHDAYKRILSVRKSKSRVSPPIQ
jgi:hypothetical protein